MYSGVLERVCNVGMCLLIRYLNGNKLTGNMPTDSSTGNSWVSGKETQTAHTLKVLTVLLYSYIL